jgi:hypothetical protein
MLNYCDERCFKDHPYRARNFGVVRKMGESEMADNNRLTGRLVAAARALTGVGQTDLAGVTGISLARLKLAESSGSAWLSEGDSEALRRALEAFGAIFISEADGMGAGVRLKFTRQDVRQIGRLEDEGGVARCDDVP